MMNNIFENVKEELKNGTVGAVASFMNDDPTDNILFNQLVFEICVYIDICTDLDMKNNRDKLVEKAMSLIDNYGTNSMTMEEFRKLIGDINAIVYSINQIK